MKCDLRVGHATFLRTHVPGPRIFLVGTGRGGEFMISLVHGVGEMGKAHVPDPMSVDLQVGHTTLLCTHDPGQTKDFSSRHTSCPRGGEFKISFVHGVGEKGKGEESVCGAPSWVERCSMGAFPEFGRSMVHTRCQSSL